MTHKLSERSSQHIQRSADHPLTVTSASRAGDKFSATVDAVVTASRVLVAVAVNSIADAEQALTMTQLRALMIVASRGSMHSAALADSMGVHPSNATRTCERLVQAGLLDRRHNPADRRHLILTLTHSGRTLVEGVMQRRREAISSIISRMPEPQHNLLANAFTAFAHSAGNPPEADLWPSGYTT